MVINNVVFNATLEEILIELKNQLFVNGIELFREFKNSGDNIQTNCPYHSNGQERKPSAGFNKENGIFHCFSCGEAHTLPEVISNCFGKDDYGVFGWNWLLKNFLSVSVEERKEIQLDFGRDNSISDISSSDSNRYISDEELDNYRYYHPYMYKRKLTDKIIEIFDIGYDKNTECITFPNRDKQGNTLFIARRSVNTKYFNYPANVEKQVYGIYELYKLNKFPSEIYITESMIDCLTLWTIGKYACALNGLGTDLQFKQLREMPCRVFILATDSDSAGIEARKKLREKLNNKIIKEVILPNGRKDINECSLEELNNLKEIF